MTGETFAIVGNGPGGCAAAAVMAELGHDVRLYGRSVDKVRALSKGLTIIEDDTPRTITIVRHTADLSAAVSGARNVVVMVPTSAVPAYATKLAPLLGPDSRVLLAPGHTGGALAFRTALLRARPELDRVPVAETYTLPFITRMTGPTEVTVWRRMSNLLTGVLPHTETESVVEVFRRGFSNLIPASSILETSLTNLNAIMHPPGMIGNIGWIEHTDGGFRFYSEGVTPGIAKLMTAIDDERLAIGTAYGISLPTFLQQFHAAGMITDEQLEVGDMYGAVRFSAANRLIQAPSSLSHRYVDEDIGCGLVALSALAQTVGVAVPVIDAMIDLAALANDKDYRSEGLNADALGIDGMDRDQIWESI